MSSLISDVCPWPVGTVTIHSPHQCWGENDFRVLILASPLTSSDMTSTLLFIYSSYLTLQTFSVFISKMGLLGRLVIM